MKKAKIMLSIMVVIGVVGGALAFKATKFTTTPYYYTFTLGDPCLLVRTGVVDTAPIAGAVIYYTNDYASAVLGHCVTGSFSANPQ